MTFIVGLDVSPLRIGWSILHQTEGIQDKGTIHFHKDEWVTPGRRWEAMEERFEKWMNSDVHIVGLEAVFVGPNKLGSIRAAMALGQVEMIADNFWPDARQKILTAAQWRSLCGIEGGGKVPVMEWAVEFCADGGWDAPADQDEADALAIAHAAEQWWLAQDA